MARSSILLNLTPLVVANVLGSKNLLIFGTSVLDVTSNHNLSNSKFDCRLGELWVQTGP